MTFPHFECGRGKNTFDPQKNHIFLRNWKSWLIFPNFTNSCFWWIHGGNPDIVQRANHYLVSTLHDQIWQLQSGLQILSDRPASLFDQEIRSNCTELTSESPPGFWLQTQTLRTSTFAICFASATCKESALKTNKCGLGWIYDLVWIWFGPCHVTNSQTY